MNGFKLADTGHLGNVADALPSAWYDGVKVGDISNDADHQEISGGCAARLPANAGKHWAISDGANSFFLALNADGSSNGKWTLTGVTTIDVEDCASVTINGVNYLLFADFGNNGNQVRGFHIIVAIEPEMTGANGVIPAEDIFDIDVSWPAANTPTQRDCETLLVDPRDGTMYVITKRNTAPEVYSIPWQTGDVSLDATYEGSMYNIADATSPQATGDAVGGDFADNAVDILVKSYAQVYHWKRASGETVYEALSRTPNIEFSYVGGGDFATSRLAHGNAEPQGEAIWFSKGGRDYWTASEYSTGSTATSFPLFYYQRAPRPVVEVAQFQDGVYPTVAYAGTEDTYVNENTPTTSFGTATTFIVDYNSVTDIRRGLIKFDISSIPSTAIVIGVRLWLYNNTEGIGWQFHRCKKDWDESSTWNSIGGMLPNDSDAVATPEVIVGGAWLLNLTNYFHRNNVAVDTVQGWVDGTYPNYGWMVYPTDIPGGNGQQFRSREHATTAHHPLLEVRYV